MIISLILAIVLVAAIAIRFAESSRKYRSLWIRECKRHANARVELTEWIKIAQVSAVDCAAHKTTIARLKREVTQLHERLDKLQRHPDSYGV